MKNDIDMCMGSNSLVELKFEKKKVHNFEYIVILYMMFPLVRKLLNQ